MGRSSRGTAFCTIKYIFFIFNVLVWLLGCGVLAVGIWMQVNKGPYMTVLPSHSFLSATALCIAAGAIIIVIGFCGCCGALIENQCMLIVYFVFVFVIFGLEIAATALGFSYKDEIKETVSEELLYGIESSYLPEGEKDHQEGMVAMMNIIQQDLQCCGINNYSDWYSIDAWRGLRKVPQSCCINPSENCGHSDNSNWYRRGCMEEIEYWFVQNMYVLGVVALTVAVVQILTMVAAIMLFCCLRNDKYLL